MDLKNWVELSRRIKYFFFTPKKPGARNFEIDYNTTH